MRGEQKMLRMSIRRASKLVSTNKITFPHSLTQTNNFLHSLVNSLRHISTASTAVIPYPPSDPNLDYHQTTNQNPSFQLQQYPFHTLVPGENRNLGGSLASYEPLDHYNVNGGQYPLYQSPQYNATNYSYGDNYYNVLDSCSGSGLVPIPTETTQNEPQPKPEPEPVSIEDKLNEMSKEGKWKEAKQVLGLLEKQGIVLDLPGFVPLTKAFAGPEFLKEAKAVHAYLVGRGVSSDVSAVSVCNQILRAYAERGSFSHAYDLFEKMPQRNLTSWDTMISGLAKKGLGEEAIELFNEFIEKGLKPDGEMFIVVFNACSVIGDIDKGMLHLESMSKVYGISPSAEHYASIVEMIASIGYLDEALDFIDKTSLCTNVLAWEKLMNLSRVHGNKELGDYCAEMVEHLDPSRLTEQSKLGLFPDLAMKKEATKTSGQNFAGHHSVREYRAGDRSHEEMVEIYPLLRGMSQHMKEYGHVTLIRFVLHDLDQEEKDEAILAHSEKLAIAYGLLSSPPRKTIRIMKNLRVCVDCHETLKIISKLVGRELIVRDAKRFHHFSDGACTCKDYW